jgi:hypothetical protein
MPFTKRHSTILDTAVQFGGHVEAWWEVVWVTDTSLTVDIAPGIEVAVPVLEAKPVRAILENGTDVTTNLTFNGYNKPEGIGAMQIGNDFKVY